MVGSQIGLFVVSSMGAKYAAFHSEDETQKAQKCHVKKRWHTRRLGIFLPTEDRVRKTNVFENVRLRD